MAAAAAESGPGPLTVGATAGLPLPYDKDPAESSPWAESAGGSSSSSSKRPTGGCGARRNGGGGGNGQINDQQQQGRRRASSSRSTARKTATDYEDAYLDEF